jgi:hypothetical protein
MNGIELISKERREQIDKHGISVRNDVLYNSNPCSYYNTMPIIVGVIGLLDEKFNHIPPHWNGKTVMHMRSKPYKEKLIIAGALIAAEIDRLQLIEEQEKQNK